MFLLIVLIVVLIILGLILIPKFFRKENPTSMFNLSPLEESVLENIRRTNPKKKNSEVLYEFVSKPIRPDLKKNIAKHIFQDFQEDSEERYQLYRILMPEPKIEQKNTKNKLSSAKKINKRVDFFDNLDRTLRNAKNTPPAPQVNTQENPQIITVRQVIINPFEENMRQEILDIVNFFEGEGEIILQLNALNGFEIQHNRNRARHFYESKENVHALGTNCMQKAFELVLKYRGDFSREKLDQDISLLLLNAPLGKTEAISNTLDRVQNDNSEFGYGENTFLLSELLFSVYSLIKETDGENQTEMMKRLYEELEEASEKCGTGHVVRFMNVLQGFHTEFEIKLPLKDEIYAKLSILIQRAIQEDEKMDDILAQEELLVEFLKRKQSNFSEAIIEEYKEIATRDEIMLNIINSLNRYSKTDQFVLQEQQS